MLLELDASEYKLVKLYGVPVITGKGLFQFSYQDSFAHFCKTDTTLLTNRINRADRRRCVQSRHDQCGLHIREHTVLFCDQQCDRVQCKWAVLHVRLLTPVLS